MSLGKMPILQEYFVPEKDVICSSRLLAANTTQRKGRVQIGQGFVFLPRPAGVYEHSEVSSVEDYVSQ